MAVVAAVPSHAEVVCGEHGAVLEALATRYQERPVSMGLASNGSVLEVLASDTGSWTVLITRPDGFACLLATGEGYETVPVAEGTAL